MGRSTVGQTSLCGGEELPMGLGALTLLLCVSSWVCMLVCGGREGGGGLRKLWNESQVLKPDLTAHL